MLPILEQFSNLDLKNTQMDFDATSLYRSAIWDKDSVCPKIEPGNTFRLHLNDVFSNNFNNQTFDRDGNDSAILKNKITIHQILYFNSYQLKKKLNTKKLID